MPRPARAEAEAAATEADRLRIEEANRRAEAVDLQVAAEAAEAQAVAGATRAAEIARQEAEVARQEATDAVRALSDSLWSSLAPFTAYPLYDGAWVNAGDCAVMAGARSTLAGMSPVAEVVYAPPTETVTVLWISPSGARIPWQTVAAGDDTFSIKEISGWVWMFVDNTGTCIGGLIG